MRVVVFPDGQKFPIRFYRTSEMHTVDLPSGTYEAETPKALIGALREEFIGVKVCSA
jgi:hypothetical protein